jgi:hypothetical protein
MAKSVPFTERSRLTSPARTKKLSAESAAIGVPAALVRPAAMARAV